MVAAFLVGAFAAYGLYGVQTVVATPDEADTPDIVPPSLEVLRPANGELFGGPERQQIIITAVLSDNEGLAQYCIRLHESDTPMCEQEAGFDSQTFAASVTVQTQLNSQDFSEGPHTIMLAVTDKAGNKTEVTRTITVDRSSPEVMVAAPMGTVGGETLQIFGSAIDSVASKEYWYQVLDSSGNAIPGTDAVRQDGSVSNGMLGTWNIRDYSSGTYYVRVWAKDEASNISAPYEIRFTVDHAAPTAVIQLASGSNPTASTPISLKGIVSDTTELESLKLKLGDDELVDLTNMIDENGGWQYSLANGLSQGMYVFTVVAQDIYGNVSDLESSPESMVNIQVGPFVPPVGSVITPSLTEGLNEPFVVPDTADVRAVAEEVARATDSDVLGAASKNESTNAIMREPAIIAATENGWRVLGAAWYWWLAGVLLAMAILWGIVSAVRRQNISAM